MRMCSPFPVSFRKSLTDVTMQKTQMPNSKDRKSHIHLLTLSIFALLACLAFYLLTTPVENRLRISWPRTNLASTAVAATHTLQAKNPASDLESVLKNASMGNQTVIITTLNYAWAEPKSVIDLFFESFLIGEGTKKLLKHVVMVAVDRKAYKRCLLVHPHCFLLTIKGVDFTKQKAHMSKDYLTLMWRRIDFLQSVLELGYSFVFTDLDVMWLRNPFPFLANSTADMTLACDSYESPKPGVHYVVASGGFNYVKSNNRTIEFYKHWYKVRDEDTGDQEVFNKIAFGDDFVRNLGIKFRFVDTKFFSGFCQPSRDITRVYTMHANCCVGFGNKLKDMRTVLEDWRNFTTMPSETKKPLNFTWGVPSKCR